MDAIPDARLQAILSLKKNIEGHNNDATSNIVPVNKGKKQSVSIPSKDKEDESIGNESLTDWNKKLAATLNRERKQDINQKKKIVEDQLLIKNRDTIFTGETPSSCKFFTSFW